MARRNVIECVLGPAQTLSSVVQSLGVDGALGSCDGGPSLGTILVVPCDADANTAGCEGMANTRSGPVDWKSGSYAKAGADEKRRAAVAAKRRNSIRDFPAALDDKRFHATGGGQGFMRHLQRTRAGAGGRG